MNELLRKLQDIIDGKNRNPLSCETVILESRQVIVNLQRRTDLAVQELLRQARSPVNEDNDDESRRED